MARRPTDSSTGNGRAARGKAGGEREGGPAPPARLLLVDAQSLFREALRAVLERAWGLEVVAEATTAAEALAAVRRTAPDVVLTSYRLPGVYYH